VEGYTHPGRLGGVYREGYTHPGRLGKRE